MKKLNKAVSLAILIAFLNIQVSLAQVQSSPEYKVLPPLESQDAVQQNNSYSQQRSNTNEINTNSFFSNTQNQNTLKGRISRIPVGTTFAITTTTHVSSENSQIGEMFTAELNEPISVDGNIAIPAGSQAIGQVTYLKSAGRVGQNAQLEVRFTHIKLPNGRKLPITGRILTVDQTGILKGGTLKDQIVKSVATGAVSTAGGTLAGLGVGSLVGSAGGGTIFGLTAGSLFGLGYIFARKGKAVKLPGNTKLNVVLEQPVSVNDDY